MRKWPENNKLVNAEKLISFVAQSFRHACSYKRKNNEDVPYEGFNIPSIEGISLSPEDMLKQKFIEKAEEQNKDILDIILLITFQLGFEQGQREIKTDKVKSLIEEINKWEEKEQR